MPNRYNILGVVYEEVFEGEIKSPEDIDKFLAELKQEMVLAKHYDKMVHAKILVEESPLTDRLTGFMLGHQITH